MGILAEQLSHLFLYLGTQFFNTVQVDPLGIGSHQDVISQGLKRQLGIFQDLGITFQTFSLDQRQQFLRCHVFNQGNGQ